MVNIDKETQFQAQENKNKNNVIAVKHKAWNKNKSFIHVQER